MIIGYLSCLVNENSFNKECNGNFLYLTIFHKFQFTFDITDFCSFLKQFVCQIYHFIRYVPKGIFQMLDLDKITLKKPLEKSNFFIYQFLLCVRYNLCFILLLQKMGDENRIRSFKNKGKDCEVS